MMPPRTYADLIGKAFAPSGRGPLSFDCYGLVKCVLERNGIPAPDYPSAEDAGVNAALILAAMEAGWEQVRVPEANCVVLFRMDQRVGTHVGVMVDGRKFLHALKETGVCVEDVRSELWRRRVLGFYRFTTKDTKEHEDWEPFEEGEGLWRYWGTDPRNGQRHKFGPFSKPDVDYYLQRTKASTKALTDLAKS